MSAERPSSAGVSAPAGRCTGGGPSALLLCCGRRAPELKGQLDVHALCCQCGMFEVGPRAAQDGTYFGVLHTSPALHSAGRACARQAP